MFQYGYLMILFGIFITASINFVSARFCEGGHRCSPPKECCAQGCCYLYAPPSAPRTPTPNTSHVLNLFFINHWFFWCIIFALIIAILCACSLWKKRRQICGWGSPGTHSQSGDSAGSCYAPPQYSRCSSFHHAPPPYTEVTSKPDLYPLVFTCNADNGKNGASYLMVQYFRNYIVRPVGSLSATSTVDSLSSSFICNANDANTLVPPPYSRAASPDLPLNTQDYSSMPRSASQQGCSLDPQQQQQQQYRTIPNDSNDEHTNNNNLPIYRHQFGTHFIENGRSDNTELRVSEMVNFPRLHSNSANELNQNQTSKINNKKIINNKLLNSNCTINSSDNTIRLLNLNMSQSDQQFRYILNKSNSNNNCDVIANAQMRSSDTTIAHECSSSTNANIHYVSSNSTNAIYDSCGSVDGIAIAIPNNTTDKSAITRETKDLNGLRHSLEACCQMLEQNQRQPNKIQNGNFSEESPVNADILKKFGSMRSYIDSITGSAVSSLANIDSPRSPPQATSPTGEVRELLEQIRQLRLVTNSRDNLSNNHQSGQTTVSNESTDAYDGDESSTSNGINNNLIMQSKKRPSTLQQNRRSNHRTRFFPISAAKNLRSPIGGGSILGFGRGRKGWISKSAPTTPGTAMPSCFLDDDSPLLNEHDEDADQNT